jgi:hypothetical protein
MGVLYFWQAQFLNRDVSVLGHKISSWCTFGLHSRMVFELGSLVLGILFLV